MSSTADNSYWPSTFLERGACVPFTTPMLTGTRARPADRVGLELIVPNPAGARGDYVLAWSALCSLCRPTVHDTKLTHAIVGLPAVTPTTIRRVARTVAATGLAGHAASAAAAAAQASEDEARLHINFFLLLRLIQECEPSGGPVGRNEPLAAVEVRAKRTMAAIAPRLRLPADAVASALEQLAELFIPIGLGPMTKRARLPQAIAALSVLRHEAAQFQGVNAHRPSERADMLVITADATLAFAASTIAEARAATEDLLRLLTLWCTDGAKVGRLLSRTDWLLDGWDRICRLWERATSEPEREAALDEIIPLLPIIPREANGWVGFHVDLDRSIRPRRLVHRHEDWRTGLSVQDTIAQNEALLAAMAA